MAQYKKEQIGSIILESAEKLFAYKGYTNTTIADIAKAAGISVGNTYRYYKSKEQILDEILPTEFIQTFQDKLLAKILTGKSKTIDEQSKDDTYIRISEEYQRLILSNRLQILILLRFPEGTPYECFRKELVTQLSEFILDHFISCQEEKDKKRDLLNVLYDGYIYMTLNILTMDWDESKMLLELRRLNEYHLLGLKSILN